MARASLHNWNAMKTIVEFHGVAQSEAIERYALARAEKLARFFDRIVVCRVAIEAPHQHHRKGKHYRVRVDITVPGGEVVAGRDPTPAAAHKDVYVAMRDTFLAARRRLEDYVRRVDGRVKAHEPMPRARVTRLFPDDGYGFLESAEGREIYFHQRAVLNEGFRNLRVGDRVRYVEESGEKGPQASTVRPAPRRKPRTPRAPPAARA